ncbi:melanocyte-stimulating hormone receptor-like [Oculina patagonica]
MNSTSSSSEAEKRCESILFPEFPLQFFPEDFYGLLVAAFVLELAGCPLTVLLNALVIVAVKTKRRLQTHPNILLACLALTDLMVGLVVQPLHITMTIYLIQGKSFNEFCDVNLVFMVSFAIFCIASLFHLVLISAERFFAIKHSFTRGTFVTKARLLVASTVAWISTTALPLSFQKLSAKIICAVVLVVASISLIILLQVVVYKDVRRHEKQILSHQLSLEARAKFQKERKALKLTTVIIITIILCYVPSFIFRVVVHFFGEKISPVFKTVALFVACIPVILNSVFDPIIYTVKKKEFRVAFIELLLRKSFPEAKEYERKLFGSSDESVVRPEAGQEGERQEQNSEGGNQIKSNDKQEDNPENLASGADVDENNTASAQMENFSSNALDNSARATPEDKPQSCLVLEKLQQKSEIPEEHIVDSSEVHIEIISPKNSHDSELSTQSELEEIAL